MAKQTERMNPVDETSCFCGSKKFVVEGSATVRQIVEYHFDKQNQLIESVEDETVGPLDGATVKCLNCGSLR